MRALVLAFVMLLPSALAIPLVEPQDDAGSGADAGNTRGEALAIPLGTHNGRLVAARATSIYVRDPLLDASDWYAVTVPVGSRLTLDAALLSGEPVTFELRRPDGGIAAWTVVGTPRSVSTVTDVGGTWWVHATAFNSAGGAYRFTVAHAPLAAPVVAHAGPGWLAARVDVDGEPKRLDLTSVFASSNTGIRRDLYIVSNGSFRAGVIDGAGLLDPVALAATGIRIETGVHTHGGLWTTFETQVSFPSPGRYHVVVVTQAEDAYTFLRDAAQADASSVGRDVVALRAADFDAPVAASVGAVDAGILVSAAVSFSERAFVGYICGDPGVQTCTFTKPGGSPTPLGFGMWGPDEPGTWRFSRDGVGFSSFSGYVLLAADVRLP